MSEEMLNEIIISTIVGEEHLGENLKQQCCEYIKKSQQEKQDLIKYLEDKIKEATTKRDFGYTLKIYQEILDKVKGDK